MAKIELKISDPKALDRGTSESPVQMTYGDTDSPIVIDTDTAFIECESQNKSAAIMQWKVDFANHKMLLADDTATGDFQDIDKTTALGIVGQLTREIGIPCLQKFLTTLDSEESGPDGSKDKSPDLPTGEDKPTGDSPELPTPINPDEM